MINGPADPRPGDQALMCVAHEVVPVDLMTWRVYSAEHSFPCRPSSTIAAVHTIVDRVTMRSSGYILTRVSR